MNHLRRTSLLVFWVMAMAVAAVAQTAEEALQAFMSSPGINKAKTAVLVTDLKTGKTVVSANAAMPLVPASIMKCVTTATLLQKTGSKYRYETPVFYTGRIRDGVLEGNLVVRASGDPSVNTTHEPGSADIVSEIVDALRALHVTRITGSVMIDEKDFPGDAINPTWQSGDLPHAYGTGTHGFNFEDNASGQKSVRNPDAVFKSRLYVALSRAGISMGSAVADDSGSLRKLCDHQSEQIDEIMRSCMMRSDNQFAEGLLRTVGSLYAGEGSTAKGAEEVTKYWRQRKAAMDGVKIVDGSGLSRSNRVTANFMADVLRSMSGNPYYASFFPLAGQEGTLRKFLAGTPLEGEIAMKTGSMNGIQCYAGYKLDSDYAPTHVVVAIMNEMPNRTAARAAFQSLLLSLFPEN